MTDTRTYLGADLINEWFGKLTWDMPGWEWRYEPFRPDPLGLFFVADGPFAGRFVLIAKTKDTYGKFGDIQVRHDFQVPLPMDRDYLPHWVRQCIRQAVTHEADEWIRYDGVMLFDPHEVKL